MAIVSGFSLARAMIGRDGPRTLNPVHFEHREAEKRSARNETQDNNISLVAGSCHCIAFIGNSRTDWISCRTVSTVCRDSE
jgi:hypothetical protein